MVSSKFCKKYCKKRTFKRKKITRKAVAKIARSVVQRNQELKFFDVSLSGSTLTRTGFVNDLLANIGQGDTINTRDGSKLKLRGVLMRLTVDGNPLAATFNQQPRVMLVLGKAENQIPLTVGSILSYSVVQQAYNSPYNYYNTAKYQILWDRNQKVASGFTVNPGTPASWNIHKYVPVNKTVTYATTTTNIMNHGVYLVTISDSAADHPTLSGYIRLYFTDS